MWRVRTKAMEELKQELQATFYPRSHTLHLTPSVCLFQTLEVHKILGRKITILLRVSQRSHSPGAEITGNGMIPNVSTDRSGLNWENSQHIQKSPSL